MPSSNYAGDAGISGSGVVINYGQISGPPEASDGAGGDGISLVSGKIINSGIISRGAAYGNDNGQYAVYLGGGTLQNSGTLLGGVDAAYTTITNTGTILSRIVARGGSITNDGSVNGSISAYGVLLLKDARLTNFGTVIGGTYNAEFDGGNAASYSGFGVALYGHGTVTNAGLIVSAKNDGAYNGLGAYIGSHRATLTNLASGTIKGLIGVNVNVGTMINYGDVTGDTGVYIDRDATLITSGTISTVPSSDVPPGIGNFYYGLGEGAAVAFATVATSFTQKLIVEPGAVFNGLVIADAINKDVLEVAGSSATALTGIGTEFENFQQIDFASGAAWTIEGNEAGLAAGQTIGGFTLNDTIFLNGFAADSHTYVTGQGLILGSGADSQTLDITGSFSTSSFTVIDQAGGTEILLCYLRGTRLATPAGEVPVQNLAIGDTLITRFSGYRRIKWIGRQSFSARFIANNRDQIPVRIAAGALGPQTPNRDLWVSPGHAMLLGDVLVLASSLVNGVTITQSETPDEIHYYQVEFETHDCVLAQGCWSESFCDYASLRNQFHNVGEFHALYPDHVTPTQHLMCAPRPVTGPALAAALAPVVTRAAALATLGPLRGWIDQADGFGNVRGWAQDIANPYLPVELEIFSRSRRLGAVLACDYRGDLDEAGFANGRCSFSFSLTGSRRVSSAGLRVRRVSDGAELPMAPHCGAASDTSSNSNSQEAA